MNTLRLTQAIEQAGQNGWDSVADLRPLLLSPGFAKALFGEDILCELCSVPYGDEGNGWDQFEDHQCSEMKTEAWRYHLGLMVTAEDPLAHIAEYLNLVETNAQR